MMRRLFMIYTFLLYVSSCNPALVIDFTLFHIFRFLHKEWFVVIQ